MERMKQNLEESQAALPSLIKAISANEVAGFDSSQEQIDLSTPVSFQAYVKQIEASSMANENEVSRHQRNQSISISMPPSPVGQPNTAILDKFYSQPMPKGCALNKAINGGIANSSNNPRRIDRRFDSFKTCSGKLERQLSNLRGKHRDNDQQSQIHHDFETMPVDRYFDALEGPELDTLRASEEIVLPDDKKWPFLLRFPITSFSMCLGVSSQAIMWKSLASSGSTEFIHVSPDMNLVLWFISVALLLIISTIYALKIIFYFEAVRREYYHPIRVNFFFAPWITLLFLAHALPPSLCHTLHSSTWYVLMAPILSLELKIYGQWMSGGERRLSKVANPSNHLSVVGNFVGALVGASMGLKEGPLFFFAVGMAHYMVLFVTLYQRLPTNATLPKELHPVFFLFVAAPSVASMAWATIHGSFDYGSRMAYFIALFLYVSLAVRLNFFRGFRFSLAWWAYTFPMTAAAIATIKYSIAVTSIITKCLTLILCIVATLTVTVLLVITIVHALVLRDLFPNDIAIAISERRPKKTRRRRWYHRRGSSSDNSSIEQYLKYANSDEKDMIIEASSIASPNKYQDSSLSHTN